MAQATDTSIGPKIAKRWSAPPSASLNIDAAASNTMGATRSE
jgi:hypothetical protein